MEESRFDLLLRKAGEQAMRRETLGTLLGSALLLNAPGESEATKKAKRRKRRKRQQRSAVSFVKPIALWLDNTAGTRDITVIRGNPTAGKCCNMIGSVVVPAGERTWVAFRRSGPTTASYAFMWIAGQDPLKPR